jgi:hypothetical protein
VSMGFRLQRWQSDADECLFSRKDASGIVLVLVWVNDFLVLSDSVSHIDVFHAFPFPIDLLPQSPPPPFRHAKQPRESLL